MRIVVSGAGIAGLASALALARPGREITVCERRTGFGETGAGIQLSPNATAPLVALGLGPALARVGREPDAVIVRSLLSGREIGRVALGRAARERYGAPFCTIARADLHEILLDAVRTKPEIRLRVGRSVERVEMAGETATVALRSAGGADETLGADLVIGADGLRSPVRAAIGDRREPVPTGYAAFRAIAPAAASTLPDGDRTVGLWLGSGRHLVHYPIGPDGHLNLVLVARRPQPFAGWSDPVERAAARSALGRAADPVRRLVEAAPEWVAWSLAELPARSLGQGRVALLGDAAHPVLPYLAQGGSLAIEDAAHLAALLGPDPASVPATVARYGRERLPRVRRVQDAARRNGRAYHAAGPIALARDMVMRRLGPDGMRERYDWVYGWKAVRPD